MDYSEKIKEYREKELITQKELAKILGVGISNVSRWENNIHQPTIKIKRKLRELFKLAGIKEN